MTSSGNSLTLAFLFDPPLFDRVEHLLERQGQGPVQHQRRVGRQANLLLEGVEVVPVGEPVRDKLPAGGLEARVHLVDLQLREPDDSPSFSAVKTLSICSKAAM